MIKNCRKVAKEAKDKNTRFQKKKSDEKDRKVPAFSPFFSQKSADSFDMIYRFSLTTIYRSVCSVKATAKKG